MIWLYRIDESARILWLCYYEMKYVFCCALRVADYMQQNHFWRGRISMIIARWIGWEGKVWESVNEWMNCSDGHVCVRTYWVWGVVGRVAVAREGRERRERESAVRSGIRSSCSNVLWAPMLRLRTSRMNQPRSSSQATAELIPSKENADATHQSALKWHAKK